MVSGSLLELLQAWITDWGPSYPAGEALAIPFRDWLVANSIADQTQCLIDYQAQLQADLTWSPAVALAAARIVDEPFKREALEWTFLFACENVLVPADMNAIIAGVAIFAI